MTANPDWAPSPSSRRSAERIALRLHGLDFERPDEVGDATLVDVVTGRPVPRPAPLGEVTAPAPRSHRRAPPPGRVGR